MVKEEKRRPTDSELEILKVLWQRGPSTVREVYETINESKPTGYTTILKLLQIMAEKGLVSRNEELRAHVYEAKLAQELTERQLVGDLLERLFDGSSIKLVMRALSTKKASPKELSQIREMLDEYERGKR